MKKKKFFVLKIILKTHKSNLGYELSLWRNISFPCSVKSLLGCDQCNSHLSAVIFLPFLLGQKRSESEMEDGKVDLYGCCSPYSTYAIQYTEKAYDRLVQLGEYNILNNEDLIMQALHTAVARKRQKRKE